MADQITPVDYYVGTVPHRAGEGARILNAIKDKGLNLLAFFGYRRSARQAELIIVPPKGKGAVLTRVAAGLGLKLEKNTKGRAFYIEGEDRPGALAELLQKLAEADINVESAHGICGGAGRYGALITVSEADFRKAQRVLAS